MGHGFRSNYPPAEPEALAFEPLKAAHYDRILFNDAPEGRHGVRQLAAAFERRRCNTQRIDSPMPLRRQQTAALQGLRRR